MKRHFLFLQGVCSPFFSALAQHLRNDGHSVTKVNFNGGDVAYWRKGNSLLFRGRPEKLKDFYDQVYRDYAITDQVLFGDRRPVHRPAIDHAEVFGIRTHVFEEGYFRPHWVTLEREGVNGHSLLPRDPDWFLEASDRLPELPAVETFKSKFFYRAMHDCAYHSASAINSVVFPHYQTHASVIAPVEYCGYMWRFSMMHYWKRRDDVLIKSLVSSGTPYYILPLQLSSDAQIRDHSRFSGMVEVMEYVLDSFARHAPAQSRLVVKNHPLDFGLINYAAALKQMCKMWNLEGRVDYLESGNLELLIAHAAGVVTVNSTVGAVSLGLGCPTVTLSDPIYNLPGLTFQGSLDDFWRQGNVPDAEFYRRFKDCVIFATQVNGGFYCRKGIDLAVRNSARILSSEVSPLESIF